MSSSSHQTFPLARSVDIPFRHVHQAKLLGQEFAVWRDDGGAVNMWENRCVHRGVRLSIGLHLGSRLRCQYHGWEYASGSGSCVAIPAHSSMTVPVRVAVKTFHCIEAGGMVWGALNGEVAPPASAMDTSSCVSPVTISAPMASVLTALQSFSWDWFDARTREPVNTDSIVEAQGSATATFLIRGPWGVEPATALLQPLDTTTTALYFQLPAKTQHMPEVHRRYLFWARQIAKTVEAPGYAESHARIEVKK